MLPDSSRDAEYRYGGTYVSHPETKTVFSVSSAVGDEVYGDSLNGDSVNFYFDEVEWSIPPLGLINSKGFCYFLHRNVGSRGYKRGYLPDDVIVTTIGSVNSNITARRLLENTFFPYYYSVQAAIKRIKDGKATAAAFSPRFAVAFQTNFEDLALFYNDKLVGYFSDDCFYVHHVADYIVGELQELYSNVEVI